MSTQSRIARAAAVLAAAALGSAAHAAATPLTGQNGDYAFNGSVDGVYTISLDAAGTYDFSSLLSLDAGSSRNYNFNTGTTYLQLGNDAPMLFSWRGKTGSDLGEFTIDAPTTLSIFVDVNANAHNGISGAYTGDFRITSFTPATSPVPEPATPALLVAGLGLLGFLGRRRAR